MPLTAPTTEVVAARVREREATIQVLVDAFEADPFIRWIFPDGAGYRAHFPALALALGGTAFEDGSADRSADGAGAALWVAPTAEDGDETLVAVLQASTSPGRHRDLFTLLERAEAQHPRVPHWYLPFIGVAPSGQGQGIGSALMSRGLERCDRDGLPAYLEASTPRNRALYERHGFAVVGEIRVADSPPLWPMLRPAR